MDPTYYIILIHTISGLELHLFNDWLNDTISMKELQVLTDMNYNTHQLLLQAFEDSPSILTENKEKIKQCHTGLIGTEILPVLALSVVNRLTIFMFFMSTGKIWPMVFFSTGKQ